MKYLSLIHRRLQKSQNFYDYKLTRNNLHKTLFNRTFKFYAPLEYAKQQDF